jgi:hypothetical protein
MLYKLVTAETAEKSYLQIINYLKENFTSKEVSEFIQETKKIISLIVYNPFVFQNWNYNTEIKWTLINKKTILYFSVKSDEVHLYLFFDARQNPEKLNFLK